MANAVSTCCIAECFWTGVREEYLRDLDQRIATSIAAVDGDGGRIRYLGWLLVIDDEVVLVLFQGPPVAVRRVAEHARIPFSRILPAAHAPWPPNPPSDEEIPE
jgi:hypothetical protein